MLKHEEMIENVHRRIAQYEEEKKMKHSKFDKIISAIKPGTKNEKTKSNDDGYIEVISSSERIEPSHRILRIVSTLAAGAVLVTGIGATGMLLRKNKSLKPAETDSESNLDEAETTTMAAEIVVGNPFSELLACKYDLVFPNLDFTDSMREKIKELFDSQESWRAAANYSRFLHYDNGGAYSPLTQRMILANDNYYLQICDDNIIEYAVLEDLNWKKKFYECDSLALINGIAEIMESEFKDNGVDFDEDVSDFGFLANMEQIKDLSDIQKTLLGLCMKGSSWKMETMEANRDFSMFDLTLISPSSGHLYINKEYAYSDENTGIALFIDKDGISYTCDNNIYFGNNLLYIMSEYDYPDLKTEITITDGDGKVLISSDDNNRARLENFIYYDLPSLLNTYDNYNYPNDYAVNSYNIDISYRSGDTMLRNAGFSISNFGEVGRVDYVLDPVSKWCPAGCTNYYMDILDFDVKLHALINNKQDEKAPEDKKPEDKKTEEVQPTTENRKDADKSSSEEKQQDKPSNNEEHGQDPNGNTAPTQVPDNAQQEKLDPKLYHEDVEIPTPHTAIWLDERDSGLDETLLASCITHDNDALDKFMAEKFEPLLEYEDGLPYEHQFSTSTYGYSLFRIYETNKTYMSDTETYIMRDGFYVGNAGFGGVCSYIYVNGDWQPAGAENFKIDFKEFEKLLKELLKDSELPKE
ncbi:hypothetical protein [Ruminococcus flavefaciens]|uniref:hypothetical protein n=1 Tax=Ruminococcus flavefaciens TaxID=1265 RepID=UPI00046314DB|nr:hypothetical protein [Ruminococcus flavefaciens]